MFWKFTMPVLFMLFAFRPWLKIKVTSGLPNTTDRKRLLELTDLCASWYLTTPLDDDDDVRIDDVPGTCSINLLVMTTQSCLLSECKMYFYWMSGTVALTTLQERLFISSPDVFPIDFVPIEKEGKKINFPQVRRKSLSAHCFLN